MNPKIYRRLVLGLLLTSSSVAVARAQMAWREEGNGWARPHGVHGMAGPQGNLTADRFDDTRLAWESGSPIRALWGRSGDIVDALQALNGHEAMPFHGGNGGSAWGFCLDPGDFLVEVRGFYGDWSGRIFVSQLTFVTARGRVYGPFGTNSSVQGLQTIEILAPPGKQIIAFTGSTDGAPEADGSVSTYLSSLGAIFAPQE